MERKVLVTLTGGTASGKSYLFNYIRDVAKLPCLISTTTRAPRKGEVEGSDYYFISEEESKSLEAEGQFAELAIYKGVRYGVTQKEFHSKLSNGVAFLIVEPSGVEHYAQPAIDVGAAHLAVYVHTDPAIRVKRFKERAYEDIVGAAADKFLLDQHDKLGKTLDTYFTRFEALLGEEMRWGNLRKWDRTVFGVDAPAYNLEIILRDVDRIRNPDYALREQQ